MKPGMEFLLDILRGEPSSAAVEEDAWHDVLDLAEEQHVLPYFAARLRESGEALPEAVEQRLAEREREAVLAGFRWTGELKGLLASFAKVGIAMIPLKGPMLAERLYGGVQYRMCRDLDLLVHRGDVAAAEALLVELGFDANGRPNDFHHGWRRAATLVELHFDVAAVMDLDFAIEGAWQRVEWGSFAGVPALQFAEADELLFLCLHGLRHSYERLNLVLDVALALEHSGTGLRLRPEVAGMGGVVMLGCALAQRLRPRQVPAVRIECSAKASARIERAAEEVWVELMTVAGPSHTWRSQQALFLATELTRGGRIRRLIRRVRSASARLLETDYAFAARYGVRRRGLVWMLRQMRLLVSLLRRRR
jgi:hypothetical protein